MCVRTVIDTSALADVVNAKTEWSQFMGVWFNRGDGLIVYTDGGRFAEEMKRAGMKWQELQETYRDTDRMELIPFQRDLERRESEFPRPPRRSADPHILALALEAKAEVLCSHDRRLREDFTDPKVLPALPGRGRDFYPLKDKGSRGELLEEAAQVAFLDRRKCSNQC